MQEGFDRIHPNIGAAGSALHSLTGEQATRAEDHSLFCQCCAGNGGLCRGTHGPGDD